MSGLGQSRRFASPLMTSGLPQEADTVTARSACLKSANKRTCSNRIYRSRVYERAAK